MQTAHAPQGPATAPAPRPSVVLDTQVVLDWLVFRDPTTAHLGESIERGDLRWLAAAAMCAELEHVLNRGVGAAWQPDRRGIAATLARLSIRAEPGPLPQPGLRCSDPTDQVFIDLALSARAQWLFSRDRALLRLARRARPLGLIVTRPADWLGSIPAG